MTSLVNDPHERLRDDPVMAALIDEHGELTIEPTENLFERLIISILRQQVSMASAAAIRDRLFDAVEITPAGILDADEATLVEAGLSQQKRRYVKNVAEAFTEHGYSKAYFTEMSDAEIVDVLTSITGIGEWTAEMQLLFTFGRPDVFPVGDLGIRKGMWNLFGEDLTRGEMTEIAHRWAPYRSYASLYLWRVQEDISESVAEVVNSNDAVP